MPDCPHISDDRSDSRTVGDAFDDDSPAGPQSDARIEMKPKLLCVRPQEPSWVFLTLGLNVVGLGPPRVEWVSTPIAAVSRLREERFDCILLEVSAIGASIRDNDGPFGLIRAIRAAGGDESLVIVAKLLTDAEWAEACALDCDVFVSPRGWDSPAFAGIVKRAIVRGELARENRRLKAADHRRLVRERDESQHLLEQQRRIIAELETLADPNRESAPFPAPADVLFPGASAGTTADADSADELAEHYRELLRSYVLMGSGSLVGEIARTADRLVAARFSPPDALQLHLNCVERLVRGLGSRSARHVISRADLLAVELMTHLADRSQRLLGSQRSASSARATGAPLRNVTGTAGIDLA